MAIKGTRALLRLSIGSTAHLIAQSLCGPRRQGTRSSTYRGWQCIGSWTFSTDPSRASWCNVGRFSENVPCIFSSFTDILNMKINKRMLACRGQASHLVYIRNWQRWVQNPRSLTARQIWLHFCSWLLQNAHFLYHGQTWVSNYTIEQSYLCVAFATTIIVRLEFWYVLVDVENSADYLDLNLSDAMQVKY